MEHETQTIEHLRSILAKNKLALELRDRMLADIIPHILTCEQSGEDMDHFVVHEWYERHFADVEQFKQEYGKENGRVTNTENKL